FRLDDRSVGCGTTHEPDTPEVTDSMQTQEITLLAPLTVSAIATLCTIVMHALVLLAVVHFVLRQERLARAGTGFWRDVVIVGLGVCFALAGPPGVIGVWAGGFVGCGGVGEFP